jgi:hypothetical protein
MEEKCEIKNSDEIRVIKVSLALEASPQLIEMRNTVQYTNFA